MAIEVQHLKKHYKEVKAVDDIGFYVKDREFFAFLGPNGAGKSTSINILTGLLKKDSGSIKILNRDIEDSPKFLRQKIGVVFQKSVLDEKLNVQENLFTRAVLYGMNKQAFSERIGEIDRYLDIKHLLKRRYGQLSGGQKRRADVVRALIHSPEILILDEPTTGLDPQTRNSVWKFLSDIQQEEKLTVFLTTHYMEETENADRIAIIDHGKIIAIDTPFNLKAQYARDTLRLYPEQKEAILRYLATSKREYTERADSIDIYIKGKADLLALIRILEPYYQKLEVKIGNMDSVFLAITGKAIRED